MPLYEVVLESTYHEQQIVNRFNYVSEGIPAAVNGSLLLLKGMGFIPDNNVYPTGTLFNDLRTVQSNEVSYVQVSARDVYSVTDFYENPYPTNPQGLITNAVGLSPAVAYGLRTNRVRTDIRRGQKRFVGVPENANAAGGMIEASTRTSLLTLATRMAATLTVTDEGNTVTFVPCIVSMQKYPVPGSTPVRYAYRYYPESDGGEAEQLEHIATGVIWDAYASTRTQTSRQYGRGR